MNETPQQMPNQQPVKPQPQPEQQIPVQPEQLIITPRQPQTRWLFLVLALVVALAAYAGVAYWQDMWPFHQQGEDDVMTSPTPTPTPIIENGAQDRTENWEIYRNEKYGFEIKYPDKDYYFSEINPNHFDINGKNSSVEILIWENVSGDSSIENLQNEITKRYGPFEWPFKFPPSPIREDQQIEEFSVDNYPAIRSDYISEGEGGSGPPAVQIFTLNSQYVYLINYMGDIGEGDLIFSTFKFLNP